MHDGAAFIQGHTEDQLIAKAVHLARCTAASAHHPPTRLIDFSVSRLVECGELQLVAARRHITDGLICAGTV